MADDRPTRAAMGDHRDRSASLEVHVLWKVQFCEAHLGTFPQWEKAVFGERGHGPGAVPWDGRFRPIGEFEPRWRLILAATTRDWVNLDLFGVKDGVLVFVVEYLTDDRVKRTWPSEAISINGGCVPNPEEDELFQRAHW
jgi:hypothetical protein